MLACQIFQLRIGAGHAEDEVDVRVAGEVTGVERGDSVGVELQFLVLVGVQPARTELELVAALCPRNVVAILETLVPVLPWIVARAPRYVDRRTLKLNLRHAVQSVVLIREEAGCIPSCWLDECTAAGPSSGVNVILLPL